MMRKIPRVVGVAGGPSKLKAIRVALKAKLIDVIVTDHVTATELLAKSSLVFLSHNGFTPC
jgi:DNA-binding transcriptional regulator LsrR (DeoR family)